MYHRGEDVFYYISLYNENYPQPKKADGIDEGIIRGNLPLRRGARISGRRRTVPGSSVRARSSSR